MNHSKNALNNLSVFFIDFLDSLLVPSLRFNSVISRDTNFLVLKTSNVFIAVCNQHHFLQGFLLMVYIQDL